MAADVLLTRASDACRETVRLYFGRRAGIARSTGAVERSRRSNAPPWSPTIAFLKIAWRKWRAFAHMLGNFQARVLLTVFYFIMVGPIGLVLRWRSDPMVLKRPSTTSFWIARQTRDRALEDAEKQS